MTEINYFEMAKKIISMNRIKDPNPKVEILTEALWKIRDLSIMVQSDDPKIVMKAAEDFIKEVRDIANLALIRTVG